jgi:hypothetical protein
MRDRSSLNSWANISKSSKSKTERLVGRLELLLLQIGGVQAVQVPPCPPASEKSGTLVQEQVELELESLLLLDELGSLGLHGGQPAVAG